MKVIDINTSEQDLQSFPYLTFNKIRMNIEDNTMQLKISIPFLTNDNYFVKIQDNTLCVSLVTRNLIFDKKDSGISKTKVKNNLLSGFLILPSKEHKYIKSIKKASESLMIELVTKELYKKYNLNNAKARFNQNAIA